MPLPRRIPEAEAVMRRLAGFGMAVLLALSLVGVGFDVATARLGQQTIVAAPAPTTPFQTVGRDRGTTDPALARPQGQQAPDSAIAPMVSASRSLRNQRAGSVM